MAARKLADFRKKKLKIDPKLAKLTVEELCDRYAETLARLSASSVKAKRGILARAIEIRMTGRKGRATEVN
jgi:hypothetical protein